MTDYHYDPLPDDGCIRTVAIHPGESHEDVLVSLTCARFDPDRPPLYEALSYVWGSNENPQHIQVADKLSDASPESCPGSNYHGTARLPVTQNLAVALRHLRLLDRPRVMWIDAICINQQDNVEKGPQVAKMGDIYSKASRVVVWLGPAQDDSHAAVEVMRHLGSQIEVNWHDDAMKSAPGASDLTLSDRSVILPVRGELWRPIFDLLSRPWFDRLWVRQEIYLATDVVQTADLIPNWTECRGVPVTEAIQVYRRILPTMQPDEAYPHGGSLVRAYAHSLVNGSIAERRSNKSGGWPLSKAISGLVEKLVMGHPFSPGELDPGTPFASGLNALANFTDRRLFKGNEGHIGMAPPPVRAGDEVWAIVGCSVPMLLRRVDKDRFLVVSECYVEGLADGEGLLGPLPQGIRGVWAPNERGQWMRGLEDVRTGETFFRDPRMESLGLFQNTSEEEIRNPQNSFTYEPEKLMQLIPGMQRIDLV
ncbi:hypothetical protein INS49_005646 [Diaporthe citri]|uniref:uncharacterized protein n=1 Tax=Diaporthe citri TaxID=83186 RepID=UPI001C80C550|nr:uncharacterized protein INS49_005646 [Diaporthe citri]KAG6353465.1 hypothetical protein INS49_005646 [Diaporthe citri]